MQTVHRSALLLHAPFMDWRVQHWVVEEPVRVVEPHFGTQDKSNGVDQHDALPAGELGFEGEEGLDKARHNEVKRREHDKNLLREHMAHYVAKRLRRWPLVGLELGVAASAGEVNREHHRRGDPVRAHKHSEDGHRS